MITWPVLSNTNRKTKLFWRDLLQTLLYFLWSTLEPSLDQVVLHFQKLPPGLNRGNQGRQLYTGWKPPWPVTKDETHVYNILYQRHFGENRRKVSLLLFYVTFVQGVNVGMLGRQNERKNSYVRLAYTSIFGLCNMSVSNCYSVIYSSLLIC